MQTAYRCSCTSQRCSGTFPAAAHASTGQRLRQQQHILRVSRNPYQGSDEFNSDSNANDNLSSSSSGPSKTSWGSNWKRKPSGSSSKPVSYFGKSNEDSSIPGPAQQPAASSADTATATAQRDPQLEASIRQSVDRAAETLQEIITEVLNEMLIEEASAYVMDEQEPSIQINQAVRNAVVKRLEWLDSNFLGALNAYLAAPSVQHNKDLSELLGAVRNEVLDLVAARLPPSVQVLNSALQHNSRAGRSAIIQISLAGGEGSVPAADLDALGAAAHQLVDDMEDQQVVADRVLLARLVLLREELRMRAEQQDSQQFWTTAQEAISEEGSTDVAAEEASTPAPAEPASPQQDDSSSSSGSKFFGFHRSNLPVRCATFMKELLAVPERDRRLGLLSKAFQEDWVGETPGQASTQSPQNSPFGRPKDTNYQHQPKTESLDIVRPGRFLSTLQAMKAELEQMVVSSAGQEGGAPNLELLHNLDTIKLEALVCLDRLQNSRPTDDVSGHYDYEAELLSQQSGSEACLAVAIARRFGMPCSVGSH